MDVTPLGVAATVRVLKATVFIYPPGTTRTARVWLAIRGLGTSWLGLMVAAFVILVGALIAGWAGVWFAITVLALTWVAAYVLTGKLHRQTRLAGVWVHQSGTSAGVEEFVSILEQLDALDGANHGPVAYELEWGRIYNRTGKPNL